MNKNQRYNSTLVATVFAMVLAVAPLQAQNQTWDNNSTDSLWNTSSLNWDFGSAWFNGNNAIFGDTGAGNITLTEDITAGDVSFVNNSSSVNYNFTGSNLTFNSTISTAGTFGNITINNLLTGPGSINLNGSGNFSLTSNNFTQNNTFTGPITVGPGAQLSTHLVTSGPNGTLLSVLGDTTKATAVNVLDGGTFYNRGGNFTHYGIASIKLTGNGVLTNGNATSGAYRNNAQTFFTDQIDLTGNTLIGGQNGMTIYGNLNVSGSDVTLTKIGNFPIFLGGSNNNVTAANLSRIVVNQNFINLGSDVAAANATFELNSGGVGGANTFGTTSGNRTIANNIIATNGFYQSTGGLNTTFSGNLTTTGNQTFQPNAGNATLTFTGNIVNTDSNATWTLRLGTTRFLNPFTYPKTMFTNHSSGTGQFIALQIPNGSNMTSEIFNSAHNPVLGLVPGATSGEYSGQITSQRDTDGQFDVLADAGQTVLLSGNYVGDPPPGNNDSGLDKRGDGLLIMIGTNTYSSRTEIQNGTVQIGNEVGDGRYTGTLGSAGVTFLNNSHLVLNRDNIYVVPNAMSGFGRLTMNGSDFTILSANNTYNGTTTINNGTLQIGNSGTSGSLGTGPVVINNTAALRFNRTNTYQVNNTITGTGQLAQNGVGITNLAGNNTYSGNTTVNFGTLRIIGNHSAATGPVLVKVGAALGGNGTIGSSTTVRNNGGLSFNLSTNATSHDSLLIQSGLTFEGASNLTITTTGNATTTGSYTLLTATGGITGDAPATLNVPPGWVASASKAGNNLVLDIASTNLTVAFETSGQSVSEDAGTAQLTVKALAIPTNATTSLTAVVTFDAGNSTASLDDIGNFGNTTVTLNAANGYTANVTVTLTDDLESEGDETASFQIATITGPGVLGSPAIHVLTLLANDTGSTFAQWAAANNVTNDLTANDDGDKFLNGEEYAYDLNPNEAEVGNVLASEAILSGGNVTLTLAFTGNSAKSDIDYVVRRSATPDFTGNTLVGTWNGTNNWTTDVGEVNTVNSSQSGAGDLKDVNVEITIPVGTAPRQFLDVEIQ